MMYTNITYYNIKASQERLVRTWYFLILILLRHTSKALCRNDSVCDKKNIQDNTKTLA